ncbi:hypothetical protein ASD24_24505 [Paenibacillus sp. Root52]|uniref:hypothetical protein n=1 Tax=Paenibacillus sp. Root52 TaxID=1736552 RepID=UPI0006F5F8FD|nr:hypothetical protein [Paenibacillus sp. Root52]KQY90961.1 hypothetical protein ASD24_24505 [Paenibacillus sp. Root52]
MKTIHEEKSKLLNTDTKESYYLYFVFHDGNYLFSVVLNYILLGSNTKDALTQAGELEVDLSIPIHVEYTVEHNDIMLQVTPNDYFDKAVIYEFMIYDGNEDSPVTKKQFIKLFNEDYKGYLDKKKSLTFESLAYGVVPVNEVKQL